MNTHTTNTSTENKKPDWSEMKSKIKSRFGKLTDESIESAKENLDLLSAKLQSVYGYAKEHAEKELGAFKASLKSSPDSKVDEKPVLKVVNEQPTAAAKVETPIAAPAVKIA